MLTGIRPFFVLPICWKAERLRSMEQLQRSLTVTTTDLPVRRLVTLTRLPRGRLGWAATMRP